MVFGDKPCSDIFATTDFKTALLISDKGKSPIFGLSQFLRQASQSSNVEIAMGLRFRLRTWLSHHFACSWNVTPFFLLHNFVKILHGVGSALHDDFTSAAFPDGLG